mgnify:CR=1 FL=1
MDYNKIKEAAQNYEADMTNFFVTWFTFQARAAVRRIM